MTAGAFDTTWLLDPRDPLVFGRGGRMVALSPPEPAWLPPQATVAGLIRTTLAGGGGAPVGEEEARRLLDVHIRGPWLVELRDAGAGEPWVPIPADTTVVKIDGEERLLRGTLLRAADDEGLSAPAGGDLPPYAVRLPERWQGEKTKLPEFPFQPFDQVVAGSLRDDEEPWPTDASGARQSVVGELRVHVGIDDASQTAEPAVLFGSAGVRYAEGFGIAVEVGGAPAGSAAPGRLMLLGGESRVSVHARSEASCFPAFESYEERLRSRIEALNGRPIGVRVQLLTPAAFGGWRPESWPAALGGLPLLAAALPRFDAVSGWDLQHRRPRKVRRLVAAGAIYTFGPAAPDRVLDLCRELWGRSACEDLGGDPDSFLARPDHDGYGTMLPLPCALPEDCR